MLQRGRVQRREPGRGVEDVLRAVPGIDIVERPTALDETPGPHEQHQGRRRLQHDQRVAGEVARPGGRTPIASASVVVATTVNPGARIRPRAA